MTAVQKNIKDKLREKQREKGKVFLLIVLLCLLIVKPQILLAQSIDPALATMILLYSEKAKKTLKSQQQAMALETTGHIWTNSEIAGTMNLQEEFNLYLDSFHGIVVFAAQTYGFYKETQRLTGNMQKFTEELAKSPANAVAVALSANRNKVYRDIIFQSLEIVNDLRTVCLSDTKMTEKERLELLFAVRPKLKTMNQKLQRLIRMVKYTSLSDIWYEISGREREGADKKNITDSAFERWRSIGINIR